MTAIQLNRSFTGKLLKEAAKRWYRVSEQVLEGLPFSMVVELQKILGESLQGMARQLSIAERTLLQRKKEGRFTPEESDRLFRLARIVFQALDLLDWDMDLTREWLTQPCRGLGYRIPLQESKTDVGARAVEQIIGRLMHGVYT